MFYSTNVSRCFANHLRLFGNVCQANPELRRKIIREYLRVRGRTKITGSNRTVKRGKTSYLFRQLAACVSLRLMFRYDLRSSGRRWRDHAGRATYTS